ncbi:hypothetical protein [Neisseria meningitidis]|uniref:hypothetical protein n=1 Tax=Neisseria meningitidis TaxID=487 RepID=UPI0011873965|nr:hypothetical protein [Neisseria meningitidis]
MPSETGYVSDGIFMEAGLSGYYSGLTKIRTGDEAADSTDRTVRKATPYWFKFNPLYLEFARCRQ